MRFEWEGTGGNVIHIEGDFDVDKVNHSFNKKKNSVFTANLNDFVEKSLSETGLVIFDASVSYDIDGRIQSYSWFIGQSSTQGELISYVFDESGIYEIYVTALDNDGYSSTLKITISIP